MNRLLFSSLVAVLALLSACVDQSSQRQAAAYGGHAGSRLDPLNQQLAAQSDQSHGQAGSALPGAPAQVNATQSGQSSGAGASNSGGAGFQAARAQIGGQTLGPSPASTLLQTMQRQNEMQQALNQQLSQAGVVGAPAQQAARARQASRTPQEKLAALSRTPVP